MDPTWQFGAVYYTNPPEQCIDEGGTSFWFHNKTKMESLSIQAALTQNFKTALRKSGDRQEIKTGKAPSSEIRNSMAERSLSIPF